MYNIILKTITIKDDVYIKLKNQKRKEESFSDMFERLMNQNSSGGIYALKKLRGSIEFVRREKETILEDVRTERSKRMS